MGEKVDQLKAHLAQPIDLQHAAGVLHWDQEVNMPEEGVNARAEQLSTLSALAHKMIISDETARLLEAAEEEVADLDYDDDDVSLVRVTRRNFDKYTKIPTALVIREARASSKSLMAWRKARENDDFASYEPHLAEIVDIAREKAEHLGYEEHPYDPLLQSYEPGMTTAQVAALFKDLKEGLLPIVQKIAEQPEVDDTLFSAQVYPQDRQWEFTMLLLRDIGYNFNRGRQDKATHPFTINFAPTDVRVTTRLLEDRPQSAIFSSVHEGGHALYEQGIPLKFMRTALSGGATLALHESQSRLWENQVGRGIPFWTHYYPILRAFFPEQLGDVSFDALYRAINKVEPSFIRVEADEVTYNFHIFIRFELEQALVTGELAVADVPDAWNARYEEYLGLTPPSDTLGCMQDIHWAQSMVGYFPTYALGNLISAQLYDQIKEDLPDIEAGFARGEFAPLLNWLRDKVHKHGKKFTAPELLQRELNQEISADALLAYMQEKYTQIYDL